MDIPLLNGTFVATFEKGDKKGKPGKWKYTPAPLKLPVYEGSMKEKPQYKVIEEYEEASTKRYQEVLRTNLLDITKFLTSIAK